MSEDEEEDDDEEESELELLALRRDAMAWGSTAVGFSTEREREISFHLICLNLVLIDRL